MSREWQEHWQDRAACAGETVMDAETVAVADIKPASCKLLAHRLPDVPNLGDITRASWSEWAGRVDIITGGSPCHDRAVLLTMAERRRLYREWSAADQVARVHLAGGTP